MIYQQIIEFIGGPVNGKTMAMPPDLPEYWYVPEPQPQPLPSIYLESMTPETSMLKTARYRRQKWGISPTEYIWRWVYVP